MSYFNLGLGLFFIILGFLIKKYPNLIAGYNTMSEAQKKTVDIEGLSSHMRYMLIGMGILIAISDPILRLIGLQEHGGMTFIVIVLLGTLFMVLNAQTFQNKGQNPKGKRIFRTVFIILFFGSLAFFIIRMVQRGTRTPTIEMEGSRVIISGMYGISTRVNGIALLDTIPEINKKTNGFNYGSILRGSFDLEEFGESKLYLQTQQGPFIYIMTPEDVPIIINLESEESTDSLYQSLRSEFDRTMKNSK